MPIDDGLSGFAFFTNAASVKVWSALTDAAQTSQYLDGLALQSDWTPGALIAAPFRGRPTVLGEVLCAQPHRRLSYLIRPPGASTIYLTWLLRVSQGGCVCTLQIDEADATEPAELEDIWLPILAALQRVLNSNAKSRAKG
jgi:uncharacterized protein YndB with AHSA1/START domain